MRNVEGGILKTVKCFPFMLYFAIYNNRACNATSGAILGRDFLMFSRRNMLFLKQI